MILLDAAASRIATATSQFGLSCEPELSLQESARRVRLINKTLAPLSLPAELREFWTWWSPDLFAAPVLDGFLTSEEAVGRWESMAVLGHPRILLPIAKFGRGLVWIELQSPDHPGSRVFYGSFAAPELRLWAIGVSGLMEVIADAIESGGVVTWGENEHRLNPVALQTALNSHHADMESPEWRVPVADSSKWPKHWKTSTAKR